MIKFETQTLTNGLQVIVHEDKSTNIAVVNVAYKVGSRDEQEEHTGFAHLFEHLMFGGSANIPSYDEPLQKAGGENNAYTTPDLTNYYLTLPANNIETGFWLESDRMLSLSFDPKVLEVQRKVVIEEFNQRYINQPYGDIWHKIREMVYKVHPYKWPTIGKDISHIETATMDLVKAFFKKYYVPNNAVLVIAGNIDATKAFSLAEKWFGPIPQGDEIVRSIPSEPKQMEKRILEVHEAVPANAYYKAFNMPARISSEYYTVDLLSDVLGRGKSSRLNEQLVEKAKTFSELSAYVMGSFDPGLLVVSGKLTDGTDFVQAEKGVTDIIDKILNSAPSSNELEKVKNQAISSLAFGEVQVLNRAMNLAYFSLLGDANLVNTEDEKLQGVNSQDILAQAQEILIENNSSTLYYHANEN
jgi:predicted Zn-dependent peptidase